MSKDPLWIEHAHLKKGGLHKALGISQDKNIPEKKIMKAEHADNPRVAKMAHTAETLKKLHRRHGGGV